MNELRLEIPRLNPFPFIVADGVLLVAAALIGWFTPAPINPAALVAIALCVVTGAIVLLYPFVVNHAHRQDELLQARSEQIEALARTLSASAEQVGIAVSNLPAIAENSARLLGMAERLPASLEERLLSSRPEAAAGEGEELRVLRGEMAVLRSDQAEKISVALEGVTRAAVDLARLEALVSRHSVALEQVVAQIPRLADSLGHQASEALRRETAVAVQALHATAAEAGRSLAAATDEARLAFDRGVRDAVAHLAAQAAAVPAFPAHAPDQKVLAAFPAPAAHPSDRPAARDGDIDDIDLDEPASPAESAALAASSDESDGTSETSTLTEPLFSSVSAAPPPVAPAPATSFPDSEEEPAPAGPRSSENSPPSAPSEAALSHDGYTRLLVTAYIGIGNKLFLRGDGPGLRRDKGVPLQFVSIGKWRWESAELLFPLRVRLFKNDQVECSALGEIILEPGHHHEVEASF
jgi:hypothetical protein